MEFARAVNGDRRGRRAATLANARRSGDNASSPNDKAGENMNASIRRARAAAVMTAAVALGACAPDAMNNVQATGYNAFLNTIATGCKPLLIGARDMSEKILGNQSSDDSNYNYFLDVTSQLYYGKVSAEAYRSGVSGFLGGGADTNRSIDCILATLDRQRASSGGKAAAPPKPIY